MKINVLNKSQIEEVFTMKDAIVASKDALSIYSSGGSDVPLRINLDVEKAAGQSLYMPGYAADADALGVKIVSVYPNNAEKGLIAVPATMVLLDADTGQVCALLDGTHLTAVRTGAVAGAATDVLARPNSKIFALFGAGGQAEGQLEAVLAVRPIEEVRIFDLNFELATEFAAKMAEKFGVNIVAVDDSDDAIIDADIISCATTASQPVFNGELVKKGCHINGVGSFMTSMQEVDEFIATNARVVVDTRDGALNESGDLDIPIKNGNLDATTIVELGEIINGVAVGRQNEDEITFFKSTGSAVLDVVTARRIYEKALDLEIGTFLDL